MPTLVFFPWLSINKTVDLPGLRLIPFEKGRGPRWLPHITYKIISSILAPYHDDKNIRVGSATLMEHDDWLSGTDVPAEHVQRLFDLKYLIAFSMLARRRFTPYSDYCNFDCFELVGQPYNESGIHAFVLQTRMRHGGGSHLWDANSYPIRRPLHVPQAHFVETDLLRCLVGINLASDFARRLGLAIQDFNYANTDASGAHEHIEVVMIASAFEFLFGTDDAKAVAQRLDAVVASFRQPLPHAEAAAGRAWIAGTAETPLQAWWYDLRRWRGDGAHGNKRGQRSHVWSLKNHLLFAARLFPLLVKATLAEKDVFKLDGLDQAALASIERFLMYNHFEPQDRRKPRHWTRIEDEILDEVRSREMRATLQSAFQP